MQSHSNTEKSEVKLDTGILIGVPDIIWETCQVQWGRLWWKKSSLEYTTRGSICCVTFLIYFLTYWIFHVFVIVCHNGDRANPSPGAPFHASRSRSWTAVPDLSPITICATMWGWRGAGHTKIEIVLKTPNDITSIFVLFHQL